MVVKGLKWGKFNLHYLYDAICILAQRNAKMLNSNETNANSGMNANASSKFGGSAVTLDRSRSIAFISEP